MNPYMTYQRVICCILNIPVPPLLLRTSSSCYGFQEKISAPHCACKILSTDYYGENTWFAVLRSTLKSASTEVAVVRVQFCFAVFVLYYYRYPLECFASTVAVPKSLILKDQRPMSKHSLTALTNPVTLSVTYSHTQSWMRPCTTSTQCLVT